MVAVIGGWLEDTCRLTACTLGSAPGPTLGNNCGRTLPFHYIIDKFSLTLLLWIWQIINLNHRRNFVCDGGDIPPLLTVVVTVTTTFHVQFEIFHTLFLSVEKNMYRFWRFCQNFSASGDFAPWFPTRGSAPGPRWGLCPRYRLALHALAICPRPLSPPLFGVKLRPWS